MNDEAPDDFNDSEESHADDEPQQGGCPECGGGPPLISCISGIGAQKTQVTCGNCGHGYSMDNEVPGDRSD